MISSDAIIRSLPTEITTDKLRVPHNGPLLSGKERNGRGAVTIQQLSAGHAGCLPEANLFRHPLVRALHTCRILQRFLLTFFPPVFPMDALSSFLNHGTLPFTGRGDQIEQLLAFWRSTPDLYAMQTALVLGEAGVGKSRLIDELGPQVAHNEGMLIRLKLIPGATISFASLIARAIRANATARQLLKEPIAESQGETVAALHRLARLRPTLLVIEDIHLLARESIEDLRQLLDGLSGEFIKIILLARPVAFEARGLLEPYLTQELQLRGMNPEELSVLWERLFLSKPGPGVIEALAAVTLGNPLAIRSALRGVLQSRLLLLDSSGLRWGPAIGIEQFTGQMERYVGTLSEGMGAHLEPEELHAAKQLATLGEAFARETATALMPSASQVLPILLHKGILTLTSAPSPLPCTGDGTAIYTFTHTLLHRHLVATAAANKSINGAGLAAVVAARAPLYSILPLELLAEHGTGTASIATVTQALEQLTSMVIPLAEGTAWRFATPVLRAANSLFRSQEHSMEDAEQRKWRILLQGLQLSVYYAASDYDSVHAEIGQYLRLTEPTDTLALALQRFHGLSMVMTTEIYRTSQFPEEIWTELQGLQVQFPEIETTPEYVQNLTNILGVVMLVLNDYTLLRELEPRLEELRQCPDTPQAVRRQLLIGIAPYLLTLYDTNEQLQQRLALAKELEQIADENWLTIVSGLVRLYDAAGLYHQMNAEIEKRSPWARRLGQMKSELSWRFRSLISQAAFGMGPQLILEQVEEMFADHFSVMPTSVRYQLSDRLAFVGLMVGQVEWAEQVFRRYSHGALEPLEMGVLIRIHHGNLDELPEHLPVRAYREFELFVRAALLRHPATEPEMLRLVQEVLTPAFLHAGELLVVHAALQLIEVRILPRLRDQAIIAAIQEAMEQTIAGVMWWMHERGVFAFMKPMATRYRHLMAESAAAAWDQRIQELEEGYQLQHGNRGQAVIQISMVGEIAVQHPNRGPQPVRGARNRTLLALMVANQMLRRPLTHAEFCEVATGVENDDDYAQRLTRMAISRLRGLIGRNAVLTKTGTPRLNPDIVRVDLLQAQQHIDNALAAASEMALFRAWSLMIAALEIVRGEVPFPTQYERFFEAARDDFEHRLRSALLHVVELLLEEEDLQYAEELLRRAMETMAGDPELSDLLSGVLLKQHQRAEAERLRLTAFRLADG